jgi:hypothetical protein
LFPLNCDACEQGSPCDAYSVRGILVVVGCSEAGVTCLVPANTTGAISLAGMRSAAHSPFSRLKKSYRIRSASNVIIIVLCALLPITGRAQTGISRPPKGLIVVSTTRLPLTFEPNHGQTDRRVKYLSHGNGYQLFLADYGALLALSPAHKRMQAEQTSAAVTQAPDETSIVRLQLKGARTAAISAESMLPGVVNYITGDDRVKWRAGLETYARVRYSGVYPGVDLIYYGSEGQLEYDFVVAPAADTKQIRMSLAGIAGMHLDDQNNLIMALPDRTIAFREPFAYQEIKGRRRPINAKFRIVDSNTIGFALGEYDVSIPLVIDPVLAYSTYLGGSFFDAPQSLAVDQAGDAYVTGVADSCDFPTTSGSYDPVLPNCSYVSQGTIFVAKLNPEGTGLIYSTFVTGTGPPPSASFAHAIAVDASGNAYVAGQSAGGLPVTPGAYQSINNAAANHGINGFILKLNAAGTGLMYSTYLGGSYGADAVYAIAIDPAGNAYVAGTALSSDFPTTTGAFQTIDATPGKPYSFVSKLNATGTALIYSTYLVGNGTVSQFGVPVGQANGIAIDSSGNAYIVGGTADAGFPVTPGAFQTNYSTNVSDLALFRNTGYVTELDPAGAHQIYSSYLGGDYLSQAQAVAVDSSGNAYVTGWTTGGNVTTSGAFQTVAPGLDAYVVKINPLGSALTYATYLGGSCQTGAGQDAGDAGFAITIDASLDAYVAGQTCSMDFPVTTNAIQTTLAAGDTNYSAFLSELNPTGSELLFSTYIGGSYTGDWATGIGLDGQQNVYIAGLTHSFSFPTTAGAFQTQNNASDQGTGFVSKFTIPPGGQILTHDFALSLSPSSATISKGQSTTTVVTVTPSNGFYESISFNCSGVPNWATCNFSVPFVIPGTSTMTTTLTVSTNATTSAATVPGLLLLPLVPSVVVISLFGKRQSKTLKFFAFGIVLGTLLVNGCGGGNNSGGDGGGAQNPNSFAVTVTGSATSTKHVATFAVTAS